MLILCRAGTWPSLRASQQGRRGRDASAAKTTNATFVV